MTKKTIVRRISEKLGNTQIQTSQIVENLFNAIINTLVEEGRVELRNFGVFEVRWRKACQARNPRTGEKIIVPEKVTVIFTPGRAMEERVQSECQNAATSSPGVDATHSGD